MELCHCQDAYGDLVWFVWWCVLWCSSTDSDAIVVLGILGAAPKATSVVGFDKGFKERKGFARNKQINNTASDMEDIDRVFFVLFFCLLRIEGNQGFSLHTLSILLSIPLSFCLVHLMGSQKVEYVGKGLVNSAFGGI